MGATSRYACDTVGIASFLIAAPKRSGLGRVHFVLPRCRRQHPAGSVVHDNVYEAATDTKFLNTSPIPSSCRRPAVLSTRTAGQVGRSHRPLAALFHAGDSVSDMLLPAVHAGRAAAVATTGPGGCEARRDRQPSRW